MRGLLLVLAVVTATHAATIEGEPRESKFLKLFDLIEFSNSMCLSDSGSEVGTCFTEKECSANQGKTAGSCAKGFGVCCQYIRSCDMDTCYNNTYFQNTAYPSGNSDPGMCMMSIHATRTSNDLDSKKKGANVTHDDIKCLKLEFEDFDILGPSNGDCTNDTFTVSGAAASASLPVLCGVNTGNLMYIDTRGAPGPYKLNFNFGAQDYMRRWKIRVIQYTDESLCPPRNCLQYYTETMGTVMSYNNVASTTTANGAVSSQGLNNQNYAVCFASHDGLCDVALTSDEFDWGTSPNCNDDYIGFIGAKVCGETMPDAQLNRTGLLSFQVVSDGDNSNNDAGFKIDFMQKAC